MTSEITSVKKNTFYSAVTIFSRLFANVFIFWLLARFYGPEQFGIFTFAHALATTFIILADFGLDVLLITEISSHKSERKKIIENLFGIKLIFVSTAFLFMLLVSRFFPLGRRAFELILIFSFYLVFTSLSNFLYSIFRGYEKFIFETRASLITNILLIISSAILLFFRISTVYIALVFVTARLLGVLICFIYLKRLDSSIKIRISFSDFHLLKNKTFIFGLHLIFSYLFFQIDTFLLAKISGEYAVGIYQSVFKLIMLPLVIPDILINSLMPTLSRLHKESENEWLKLGSFMGKILIITIIPITTILYFYADKIIDLIYGLKNFGDAVFVLRVFSIILLVRFLLEPFALMLTTCDRQKIRLTTVMIATLLNITLNSYLIPKYGVDGAAIVSLIVNSFVGLIYVWFLRKNFMFWIMDYKNLMMIGLSLLVFMAINLLSSINFIIQIFIYIVFYLTIVVKFYLTKKEQEQLNLIIKKYSI
ncbi:MAG: flippase [Ignavibacterium sp.]|nr:flippase [Ignavibacterium sp.]